MEFKNRVSSALWGFTLVWLSFLLAFTWLLVRDGPPDGYSRPTMTLIIGVFWLAGLGLAAEAMRKACYFAVLRADGLSLIWQYPHKRVKALVPLAQINLPNVSQSRDSDGDPYFCARLELSGHEPFDVTEGHDRASCETVCVAFTRELDRLR
jgi:hypothetical protein